MTASTQKYFPTLPVIMFLLSFLNETPAISAEAIARAKISSINKYISSDVASMLGPDLRERGKHVSPPDMPTIIHRAIRLNNLTSCRTILTALASFHLLPAQRSAAAAVVAHDCHISANSVLAELDYNEDHE